LGNILGYLAQVLPPSKDSGGRMHCLQKANRWLMSLPVMLLITLQGFPITNAAANTPWSEHQCLQLQRNLTQVKAQQRLHNTEQLNQQQRRLFTLQARHCDNNADKRRSAEQTQIDDSSYQSTVSYWIADSSSANSSANNSQLPKLQAHNAVFQGAQAAAWAQFYQPPTQCRQQQISEADFVFCAEHKTAQRALFIQQWQTQTTAAERSTSVASTSIATTTSIAPSTAPVTALPTTLPTITPVVINSTASQWPSEQVLPVDVLNAVETQPAAVPPLPRPAGLTILGVYLSWDLFEWLAVGALLLIVLLWLTLREQRYYHDRPDDSRDNDAR